MPEWGQAWQALVGELKKKFRLHAHVLPLPTPLEQTRQVGAPLVSSQLLGVVVQAHAATPVDPAREVAPAGQVRQASPLL
jgi:hypothetical protein